MCEMFGRGNDYVLNIFEKYNKSNQDFHVLGDGGTWFHIVL